MPPFSLSVFLQAPFSREDEKKLKVGFTSLLLVRVFINPASSEFFETAVSPESINNQYSKNNCSGEILVSRDDRTPCANPAAKGGGGALRCLGITRTKNFPAIAYR
jgi:hypothetical protein